MALVMEESGVDAIRNNLGVDATGEVFNYIVPVKQAWSAAAFDSIDS
jgi:glutaminase